MSKFEHQFHLKLPAPPAQNEKLLQKKNQTYGNLNARIYLQRHYISENEKSKLSFHSVNERDV